MDVPTSDMHHPSYRSPALCLCVFGGHYGLLGNLSYAPVTRCGSPWIFEQGRDDRESQEVFFLTDGRGLLKTRETSGQGSRRV